MHKEGRDLSFKPWNIQTESFHKPKDGIGELINQSPSIIMITQNTSERDLDFGQGQDHLIKISTNDDEHTCRLGRKLPKMLIDE